MGFRDIVSALMGKHKGPWKLTAREYRLMWELSRKGFREQSQSKVTIGDTFRFISNVSSVY